MPGSGAELDRRGVLRGLGLLGALAVLPGCGTRFADTRLTVATGSTAGTFFALGTALATVWQRELKLPALPDVLTTSGASDNLRLLGAGTANVVFSQVDTAAAHPSCCAPEDPAGPRALARICDDVVHVITSASSSIRTATGLRRARVSLGEPGSNVALLAERVLAAAGLVADRDLEPVRLGLGESAVALAAGRIDAFFWSGPLPTQDITALAAQLPIRLVDLSDVLARVRASHPEYTFGSIPAGSYGVPQPVSTMLVRNLLLVPPGLPDDVAGALVEALFTAREELARTSRSPLTIDPRMAITTQPVPLHPGAAGFYRTHYEF